LATAQRCARCARDREAFHRMLSEGNLGKVLGKVKAVTEVTGP
jgi:hypothetical protein